MPSLPLIKQSMAAVGANTARTLKQMMKTHVPMIKFPSRETGKSLQEGQIVGGNPNSKEFVLTKNQGNNATSSSTDPKSRKPSINSSELPFRFKRKPLSLEEMEFIEKGGPV